ncbi:histidine phosphatase family protein [uncultured Boseongicola sp.]|uniref:histidine phosphatase family protein n=1 Tax=uncultured Boseongicola sp. TaxID=1648499 RepID=UPI0026075E24|nr:histidine phosphatase family protein [uncultured Boseongicola sp.]
MSLPDIFVLRHGGTEWNREGRWQGALDSDLTNTWLMQAVAIGESLGAFGISPESQRGTVSPQGRAWQRAELALELLGITATVIDDLREIEIGDWTELPRDDIAVRCLDHGVETSPDIYRRAPGGEGFEVLWERVGRVLARLVQPTIIVSHAITSWFCGCAPFGFLRLRNGRAGGYFCGEAALL